MNKVALAIICKTPKAGASKTRLSPPLRPEDCAKISECFIRDLSGTISQIARDGHCAGYAVYTPLGSESLLRAMLPAGFKLTPQRDGHLGERLKGGIADLLAAGHTGAILVNSDSPTLPASTLRAAVAAVARGSGIVLSAALDGGYTLIGMSHLHARVFEDIPWSTPDVFRLTLDRASEAGIPVELVPGWYDVDDAASLELLREELLASKPPTLLGPLLGEDAPESRRFLLSLNVRSDHGSI